MILGHVITTIERGGAELAVLALVKELVKKGERVVLIPIKGEKELLRDLIEVGVEVELTLLNRPFWRQLLLLINVIKLNRFDVLHAHLPRAELISRLALTFTKHVPFFITRHNAEPFFPTKNFLVSQLLSRWIVKRCHSVIAISDEVQCYLYSSKELTDPTITAVIKYGYESKMNLGDSNSIKQFRDKDELKLVTVSRLVQQKNLTFAIDIVNALKSSGAFAKLTIIGSGQLAQSLQIYSENLNISSSICFFGKTDDVFKQFEGKDIFLMTSNYEGFGMAVLEAIDFGLPVIVPNHSAFREVLGPAQEGLYHPNDLDDAISKILRVVHDSKFKRRLLANQKMRLEDFSVSSYCEKHLELYYLSLTFD